MTGLATLVLVIALAPAVAGPALAGEGLYLTWTDCALSTSAAASFFSECADAGAETLLCAFTLPQALDSVIAVEVVVDVQHFAPVLPDWWRLGPGGCRDGSLVPGANFTAMSACADFWQGAATADPLPFVYTVGAPRGQPNQSRIVASAALPSASYRALNGTDMYYAVRLVFRNAGTSSCEGCGQPACLVLNSILIGRLPGAAGGNVLLSVPGPAGANRATWQGEGADCSAVPVRATSWGRLKSLYR